MRTYDNLASALAADPAEPKKLVADADRGETWTEWPPDLWKIQNLVALHVNQHALRGPVPAAFSTLQQLQVLSLSKFGFYEPGGIGELAQLRELELSARNLSLPRDITKLTLERLSIRGNWGESLALIAKIPVTINVTLLGAHPQDAEILEREDLSAWRDLQELEIDAFEDFEPLGFERKLPRCGFAINRQRRVLWEI